MAKKVLQGIVVKDKCDKTLIIKVERKFAHEKYGKTIRVFKKYAAHDPENRFKIGDVVKIIESAPISKTKKWQVIYAS